eukprot:jgi/Picsp_1/5320/NSC_02681-R1_protein
MLIPVFVAFTGKTIELDCGGDTTLLDVKPTLCLLTEVSEKDQIVTVGGETVHGSARMVDVCVSAQSSGVVSEQQGHEADVREEGSDKNVFLYDRSLLRGGSNIRMEEIPERYMALGRKLSDSVTSSSVSEAESKLLVKDLSKAAEEWMEYCHRVAHETEVVAMAVDVGLSAVEPHYAFICDARGSFQKSFTKQYEKHGNVLSRFEDDVRLLESIRLHSSVEYVRGEKMCEFLSDVVDMDQLRELAKDCKRAHGLFLDRVRAMEDEFEQLKQDVENLFLRAPTVDFETLIQDIGDLGHELEQLADMDPEHVDAATILGTWKILVEKAQAQASRTLRAKNRIAVDAVDVMKTVSSQQSRIRAMKDCMGPFFSALESQDARITKLAIVQLLPVGYKQCLAECARRVAFTERYSSFAAELAERMGRFRDKENSLRSQFYGQVKDIMPPDLIKCMGLESPAPHCHVSVPQESGIGPIDVSLDYLKSIQLPRHAQHSYKSEMKKKSPRGSGSSLEASSLKASSSIEVAKSTVHERLDSGSRLALENAKLRAEIASFIAQDCCNKVAEMYASQDTVGVQTDGSSSSQGSKQYTEADAMQKMEAALKAKDSVIEALTLQLSLAGAEQAQK